MARPREHTDDELLDRVSRSLSASGRGGWTLSDAACGAGVHPATLVKRFGSKRELLMALSRRWVAGVPTQPRTDDPHAELLAWAASVASRRVDRERALADMAMLMEDLADDELSALLVSGWDKQVRYVAALVADAQSAGRLARAPRPELAATALLDVVNGATLRSAAYPSPREPVGPRALVGALLEGWR